MGRLSIWGAVVRVPVARLQKFTGMGRLRRDAAAELIRRLNIFKFIFFLAPGVDAEHPEEDEHVERDGQRDQREDHPAVGTNSEQPVWKISAPSTRRRSHDCVCSMAWKSTEVSAP